MYIRIYVYIYIYIYIHTYIERYPASPISAPPVPSSASYFAPSRPHSRHESKCVVARVSVCTICFSLAFQGIDSVRFRI